MLLAYFFFFNDTATTEIYTLSLHDALPIFSRRSETMMSQLWERLPNGFECPGTVAVRVLEKLIPALPSPPMARSRDRKSTRLNSSHANISYAVFCLKKKKINHSHAIIPLFF